jgi:hypothetical protein
LEVLVDEDNWHELSQISWHIKDGYIINRKVGRMHRYIMKAKDGEIVDHINNNRYNNRRCNLRIASAGLNNHNRIKSKNASSKYFGVYFNKKDKNWKSEISYDGKRHYIGTFKEEIDAAKAYNKKAIEFYKDNANLNVFN